MLPLMVHVKFTGGYDGPETQFAVNNSPIAITFLLMAAVDWVLCTDMIGLCAGNSATIISAVLVSVWNNGASADTSHWYLPEMMRDTARNDTAFSPDLLS